MPNAPRELLSPASVYRNRPATGVARVVCYSPRHDVALAELDVNGVDALLHTWQQQMRELATHPDVSFVLIFENKGEVTGVSNPHPHCQIYATNFTFKHIETELLAGRRHLDRHGPNPLPGHSDRRARGRPAHPQPPAAALLRSSPTSPDTHTKHTSHHCGA